MKWSQINVDSDQILKLGLEPRSRYPRPNFLHILPVCQTGKEIHKSKLMMMKYMYTGLFLPAFNNFMTFKFWVSEGTEGLNPPKNTLSFAQIGDIAHVCHDRHNGRWCTFFRPSLSGMEKAKFWPVLAIWLFCHEVTHFRVPLLQA